MHNLFTTGSPTPTIAPADPAVPAVLNVVNAATYDGLATAIKDSCSTRGYTPGEVDTSDAVADTSTIEFGPGAEQAATMLAEQLPLPTAGHRLRCAGPRHRATDDRTRFLRRRLPDQHRHQHGRPGLHVTAATPTPASTVDATATGTHAPVSTDLTEMTGAHTPCVRRPHHTGSTSTNQKCSTTPVRCRDTDKRHPVGPRRRPAGSVCDLHHILE